MENKCGRHLRLIFGLHTHARTHTYTEEYVHTTSPPPHMQIENLDPYGSETLYFCFCLFWSFFVTGSHVIQADLEVTNILNVTSNAFPSLPSAKMTGMHCLA